MAKRWRHVFYSLVPSWLSSDEGEKVLYSLGRVTDAFIERARLSLTARFPTYVGPTGLRMLGEERGIVQGKGEANPGFARRLRGWRGERGHLVRGSPYAMLRQIWHYFGGIKAQEIDNGGNVYTVERDGTESATHGGAWDWDGNSDWFRFWLKLIPEAGQGITSWGTWAEDAARGTGTWGDGENETWGQSGITKADANVIVNLFKGARPWKMAGTKPEWLIVVLDQDEAHAPDGTWGTWIHEGAPTRWSGWRYWKL